MAALAIVTVLLLLWHWILSQCHREHMSWYRRNALNYFRDYTKDDQGYTVDDYELARQLLLNEPVNHLIG